MSIFFQIRKLRSAPVVRLLSLLLYWNVCNRQQYFYGGRVAGKFCAPRRPTHTPSFLILDEKKLHVLCFNASPYLRAIPFLKWSQICTHYLILQLPQLRCLRASVVEKTNPTLRYAPFLLKIIDNQHYYIIGRVSIQVAYRQSKRHDDSPAIYLHNKR